MPLLNKGCYIQCDDRPYEVETTYQLKYYISSALISIDCIQEPVEAMVPRFPNEIQYYRYYVDNMFYFLGLINDRFVYKNAKNDSVLSQEKRERVNLNIENYQFNKTEFKILSKKMPRNIIEHLDERNVKTLMDCHGVGGFNVIFENSDPDMISAIKTKKELYPYNLDLVNKRVLFYDIQASQDKDKPIEVDILKLRDELRKLEQNVDDFAVFLNGAL